MIEHDSTIRVGDPFIRGIVEGLEKIVGPSKTLEEVYSTDWVENEDGSYTRLYKMILSDKSTHLLRSSHSISGAEYFKRELAGTI